MRYLLVLVFLAGCGKEVDTFSYPQPTHHGIDPAFTSQISLFESITGKNVDIASIYFTDQPGFEHAGTCSMLGPEYPNSAKEIAVNQAFWETATADEREILILHELGHCVLDRPHDEATTECGGTTSPASVMHLNVSVPCYAQDKQAFWNELIRRIE